MSIQGLHHITLVTTDAQRNVDFYSKTLGLRFVKKTVNFDDPGAYHLYYGNETGSPGSAVTFFEWKGVPKGRNWPSTPSGLCAHWRRCCRSSITASTGVIR